jgi:glycosyltransferase involved in cell wall biosynthesis
MATNKVEAKREPPLISVIVPTIGRDSLILALESINSQSYQPIEILIVCDHQLKDNQFILQVAKLSLVKVLYNSSGTASANRNLGLLKARGDFVAFLDDDDVWHTEKLKLQVDAISSSGANVICSRARYRGWKNEVVPNKIFNNDKLFVISLYNKWSFKPRQYGIPTPTLLVATKLAQNVLFDEKLSEREDIWFIHNLQILGAKFCQIDKVLAEVSSTKPHTNRKVFMAQEIDWFMKLNQISRNLGWKFLITVSIRNCLLNLKILKALTLLFKALKIITINKLFK